MSESQPSIDSADRPATPPVPSAYKYDWQFDEAMKCDAFAKQLFDEQRGLRRKRVVVLLSAALFFAFCYAAPHLGLRHWFFAGFQTLISGPGFHLVFWPLAIAYSIYFTRGYEPKKLITSRLLCFGCGYSLRGLRVDDEFRGRCPECGREYCLGEYVHPTTPQKYPLDAVYTASSESSPNESSS